MMSREHKTASSRNFRLHGLGPVENQDSPLRLGVIQAFDG
jgi:hypothetical protein